MKKLNNIVIISLLAAGPILGSDKHPKPNSPEARDAFAALKQVIGQRFQLTTTPSGLPSKVIASADCTIEIRDTTIDADHLQIVIEKGPETFHSSVYSGQSMELKQSSKGIEFKTFTEDCEEAGCDGVWYADQSTFIGSKILTFSEASPYSHRQTQVSCILL
jgi:hypothetical protein